MTSRTWIAVALAALVAGGVGQPAEARRRGDSVAPITRTARAHFKAEARDAEFLFNGVVNGLTTQVRRGQTSPKDAATTFGAALSTYVSNLKQAANDAADEVADGASSAIQDADDDTLRGAAAGDGGSLDKFAEQIQIDLDRLRKRALARSKRLQARIKGRGDPKVAMHLVFPHWRLTRRITPSKSGAVATEGGPLSTWAAVATRASDFSVTVTVAGTAPTNATGLFDVRMSGMGPIRVSGLIGPALNEGGGGMVIDAGGAWGETAVFTAAEATAGNQSVSYGVDPVSGQPSRLVHAVTLAVP